VPLQDVQGFAVSSSLDTPADGFRATTSSPDTFLSAVYGEIVTLKAGFEGKNYPQLIDGIIDVYRLRIGPSGVSGEVEGRDKAAELLDRYVRIIYSPFAFPIKPPDIDEVKVGAWTSSMIAGDLAGKAGLSLSWSAPSFTIREPLSAVGRIIDVIQQLIEPFSIGEMFKIDVWVQGSVLYVRQRPGIMTDADYTFDLSADPKALRGVEIVAEKRRLPLIGRLVLRGMTQETIIQQLEVVSLREEQLPDEIHEVYNDLGELKSRTIVSRIVLQPLGLPKSIVETMYGRAPGGVFDKIKIERTAYKYEDATYIVQDDEGQSWPNKRIQLKSMETETEAFDKVQTEGLQAQASGTWRLQIRQTMNIGYDELGRVVQVDETREERKTGTSDMRVTERTITRWNEIGAGVVEETVTTFKLKRNKLVLDDVQKRHGSGYPTEYATTVPPIASQFKTIGMSQKLVEIRQTVSSDPKAHDVSYDNPHLSEADLNLIASRYSAMSGKWEYEVRIPQVAIPWIQKGHRIKVQNIPLGRISKSGTTFAPEQTLTLPTLLVVGREFSYDESSPEPSMTATLICMGWDAS